MAKGKTALTTTAVEDGAKALEQVILQGDISRLSSEDRVKYYNAVCESVGLNPITRPLGYFKMKGREVLYVLKEATEQLRKQYAVSLAITDRTLVDDIYIVTARAAIGDRTDESTGAVCIAGLRGEEKANAMMKAETKAKRRVTLSICGMGFMDESEVGDAIRGEAIKVEDKAIAENTPAEIRDEEALEINGEERIEAAATKPELDKAGAWVRDQKFPEDARKRLSDKWLAKSYTFQSQGLDEASGEGWKDAKEAACPTK